MLELYGPDTEEMIHVVFLLINLLLYNTKPQ